MTVVAQFAAPVARVWAAYADPRQLERFWGPPTWPAKFVRHDFVVGGRSEYHMTGPDGQQSRGFFEFLVFTFCRSPQHGDALVRANLSEHLHARQVHLSAFGRKARQHDVLGD